MAAPIRLQLILKPVEISCTSTRVGAFHRIGGVPYIILSEADVDADDIIVWSQRIEQPSLIKKFSYKKRNYIQVPLQCFEDDDYQYIGRRLTMSGWNLSTTIFANHDKLSSLQYYLQAQKDQQVMSNLSQLTGKILVCWCMGKKGKDKDGNRCHGQALLHLVERYC